MSAPTFRISFSAPELSIFEKNALALSCRYRDRHFLLGSTDAILEIFSRSRVGLLTDVEIREELSRVIQERKLSIDLYRNQKKEKQTLYRKGSDLTDPVDSHEEKLFTEVYGRRKPCVQQQTHLGSRIEQIMGKLHEQATGLKRIFGKREGFFRRQSLPMHVSISLSSREPALSTDTMPDIAEGVARHMVGMEAQLNRLISLRILVRDRLLQEIDHFPADLDRAMPAFQKIARKNKDLDTLQSVINRLAERLIAYRKIVGL